MPITLGHSSPNRHGEEPKLSSRTVILVVVIVAVLIVGAIAWPTIQSVSHPSGYTKRSPIGIYGNGNFITANGVIGGSGSVSNPYIIANWDIDASQSVGIYIQNTNAHFILTNCYVHSGSSVYNKQVGIDLDNCSNGTLIGNKCSDNLVGISLYGFSGPSSTNAIINNICSSNEGGITLSSSNNNTLSGNKCLFNSFDGITLESSSNNTVCNNIISHNTGYAMDLDTNLISRHTSMRNRFWNNTLIGNNGAGSKYDSSHIQANDSGTNNWWNSTDGHGNYWSDWATPDANRDGIVDQPYHIAGYAGAKDYYPLTASP